MGLLHEARQAKSQAWETGVPITRCRIVRLLSYMIYARCDTCVCNEVAQPALALMHDALACWTAINCRRLACWTAINCRRLACWTASLLDGNQLPHKRLKVTCPTGRGQAEPKEALRGLACFT